MHEQTVSRRRALGILGQLVAPCLMRGQAQAGQLPLNTTGLEHISMTVPDPEATARFYGLIFGPQLFKSGNPGTPGFFVVTGVSYISLPAANNALLQRLAGAAPSPARIDHFCALVQDYKPKAMRKTLQSEDAPMNSYGMVPDPDGLDLQLLGVPGGFTSNVIGSRRISQDYPAVQAVGIDHIMLAVSDLEKSAAHYAKLFGKEIARTKKPERVWFGVAKTKLGLQLAATGKAPAVDHVCFKVAGFDRRVVTEKLKKLRVEIAPNNDEDVLRFRDPNGLVMEPKG